MTAQWVCALVFEIYVCRRVEGFLKVVGSHKWRGTIREILLSHFFGDVYPRVALVELLPATLLAEHGEEVFGFQGLLCLGVKWQHGFGVHVCLYVVPLFWDFVLLQKIFLLSCHDFTGYGFSSANIHNLSAKSK